MDKGDNPYEILEVSTKATDDEIKKSYRKLALKHHPDRKSDPAEKEEATNKFAKIAAAYELLLDPASRKKYDRSQKKKEGEEKPAAKGYDAEVVPVHFNDPYEVWKRDFKDQFGFEYPGAQWDFKKVPKNTRKENQLPKLSDGSGIDYKDKDKGDKKKSSSSGGDHRKSSRSKNSSTKNSSNDEPTSTALTPYDPEAAKEENQLEVRKGDKTSSELATRDAKAGSAPVPRDPNDNRPISMEVTEEKITHPDGVVETITTTTIVRPDGSTERIKMSDRADKRKDWQQPETNKNKRLTNGESKKPSRRAITDGKKKPLAITDGKKKKKIVSNDYGSDSQSSESSESSDDGPLTITDGTTKGTAPSKSSKSTSKSSSSKPKSDSKSKSRSDKSKSESKPEKSKSQTRLMSESKPEKSKSRSKLISESKPEKSQPPAPAPEPEATPDENDDVDAEDEDDEEDAPLTITDGTEVGEAPPSKKKGLDRLKFWKRNKT